MGDPDFGDDGRIGVGRVARRIRDLIRRRRRRQGRTAGGARARRRLRRAAS